MSSAKIDEQQALAQLTLWRSDPVAFCRDVFGFEPWEHDDPTKDSQASVLRAVPHNPAIAVRSGHKVGKTRLLAVIALWFYALFPGVRVVMTAPTGRQISEACWKEIRELYALAKRRGFDLGGRCFQTYAKGIRHPNGAEVFGVSTNEKDRFSGISGWLVVYLVDEGSGVADDIWEAIEGNRAGGAWLITMGNPTRTEGAFYRAFHEESHLWRTFHISSEDTPTARGVWELPGMAQPSWIDNRRKAWPPHDTHPLYAIRVRGNFPATGLMNVVSAAAVENAERRYATVERDWYDEARLEVGVDCARFGDDSNCAIARRGHYVLPELLRFGGVDGVQAAARIRRWVLELRTAREANGIVQQRPLVKVDVIGIGASVYDQLRALADENGEDMEVVPINFGAAAANKEDHYANVRAEAWFGIAEWLAAGGVLPKGLGEGQLRSDLLSPTYKFDLKGRQLIEPKDKIKERLGRSPDCGDALSLALYEGSIWRDASSFEIPNL